MQILSEIENAEDFKMAVKNIIDLLDLKQEGLKDHSIRVMHYALMIGKLLNINLLYKIKVLQRQHRM